jgi:hypothetical protein
LRVARFWLPGLAAVLVLVMCGCAHGGRTGQIDVESSFSGYPPEGGRLLLGAVSGDGHAFAAARIGPHASAVLTVPPGRYTVGVWLPGTRRLSAPMVLCSRGATVVAGQASAITLACEWH